jgi:hypothetical protein
LANIGARERERVCDKKHCYCVLVGGCKRESNVASAEKVSSSVLLERLKSYSIAPMAQILQKVFKL